MRGPFLKTAVAVLVCAALGYFAWREFQREDQGEKDKKEKVLAFDKAKVRGIKLEKAGAPALELAKQGDFWRLTAPAGYAAATAEVDTLILGFEALEIQEAVADAPGALQPFGLDPPKTRASLTLEGVAEPVSVLLGDPTPDTTAVYAQRPGQPKLFTIPAYLAGALDKQPFDLRDRDLLHVARDNVRTLDVTGPEGDYALARDDKGEWGVVRPLVTQAGRWSVDSLLGLIENLRMEAVASENATDLKPYGLDKPARTLTLGLSDGSTRKLEIGSATPEKKHHARAASGTLVALIPPALVDDLAKGLGELRAKRLMDVSTYDVETVVARHSGKEWKYTRASEKGQDGFDTYKWTRAAPDAKDLETAKVEDALFKLSGLEALEFADRPGPDAGYGLDVPELALTLSLGAGKPGVEVALGRKDGVVWARRAKDTARLKLDAAKVDEALAALKGL